MKLMKWKGQKLFSLILIYSGMPTEPITTSCQVWKPWSNQGSQFIVTQDIVDQTTDILNRFAAAASPELAAAINSELAKYNNMQDFTGLTFDEWAQAIDVEPPGKMIYLPMIITPTGG